MDVRLHTSKNGTLVLSQQFQDDMVEQCELNTHDPRNQIGNACGLPLYTLNDALLKRMGF